MTWENKKCSFVPDSFNVYLFIQLESVLRDKRAHPYISSSICGTQLNESERENRRGSKGGRMKKWRQESIVAHERWKSGFLMLSQTSCSFLCLRFYLSRTKQWSECGVTGVWGKGDKRIHAPFWGDVSLCPEVIMQIADTTSMKTIVHPHSVWFAVMSDSIFVTL